MLDRRKVRSLTVQYRHSHEGGNSERERESPEVVTAVCRFEKKQLYAEATVLRGLSRIFGNNRLAP